MKFKILFTIHLLSLTCTSLTSHLPEINIVNYSPFAETVDLKNIANKLIGRVRLKPGEGISFAHRRDNLLQHTWSITRSFKAWALINDANPGEATPAPTLLRVEDPSAAYLDPAMLANSKPYKFVAHKVLPHGFYGNIVIGQISIAETHTERPPATYIDLRSAIRPL